MTMQQAGNYSRTKLESIYTAGESAAISDWLLEHLTGIRKLTRSTQDKILDAAQEARLNQYLDRLLLHEPLQYVINEAWFCGLKFYVDQNVLIPRPETEELVEWIISHCKFPLTEMRILDVGTGSGCIAISLQRRLGKAETWACDISESALHVARRNAASLGVDVQFRQLDFLKEENRTALPAFNIIVSNPPYIPVSDRSTMDKNVIAYEPSNALFVPDNDPLVFYHALALAGKDHLKPGGMIFAEIHESLGAATQDLFEKAGYYVEIKRDMQEKDRMIQASL